MFSRHRNLRLKDDSTYEFAAKETLVPFIIDEVADIAREYVIVFPNNDSLQPCALVGVEAGANAYVDSHGRWQARYVPGHIRRQPFFLGKLPKEPSGPIDGAPGQHVMLFDQTSPQLSEQEGELIFNEAGELRPAAQRRATLLERIQKRLPATQRIVQLLNEHDLLTPQKVTFELQGEKARVISGVCFINAQRLKSLSQQVVFDLFQAGAFTLIYAHGLSLVNLRAGPLAKFGIKPFDKQSTAIEEFLSSDLIRLQGL